VLGTENLNVNNLGDIAAERWPVVYHNGMSLVGRFGGVGYAAEE